jgi:putative flippase GtrA
MPAACGEQVPISEVIILIPAYQPGPALVDLVRALTAAGARVVAVDDGSSPDCAAVFAALQQSENVELLRHVVNLGKGAALQTGLNHIACRYPDRAGVVTADADGQHKVEDVLAVAAALVARPHSLILGARPFEGELPLRSRWGNVVTRHVMRLITGHQLSDTQTGLRGIPMWMIPRLLTIPYRGYEFELEMLLVCKYEGISIQETAIQTVYLEGNRSSHFNPLWDSLRIYFVLLRFALVSLISAVLDNVVFAAVFAFWPNLVGAQVSGRVFATLFNYFGNKTTVFHSEERIRKTLPNYLLLVAVSGGISYALIHLFTSWGTMDVYPAKILAETLLFFLNFAVQRDLIFARPESAR